MCTLIALHRCPGQAPLVAAANRDEYYDRPALAPQLRISPGGMVLAPVDVRAGGTWLGVNRVGLLAAVTNRATPYPDPARRSRGLLVLDALAARTAAEAAARLAELPPRAYNPFNLFLADGLDAFALVYEEAPQLRPLAPGVHVVGNVDPDDRSAPKVAHLLARAEAAARAPAERVLEELGAVCRGHEGGGDPLAHTCVHTPVYGTRSSTLLRLGDGTDAFYHAEGPPCVTAYGDSTHLLRELGRTTRFATGEPATRIVR